MRGYETRLFGLVPRAGSRCDLCGGCGERVRAVDENGRIVGVRPFEPPHLPLQCPNPIVHKGDIAVGVGCGRANRSTEAFTVADVAKRAERRVESCELMEKAVNHVLLVVEAPLPLSWKIITPLDPSVARKWFRSIDDPGCGPSV